MFRSVGLVSLFIRTLQRSDQQLFLFLLLLWRQQLIQKYALSVLLLPTNFFSDAATPIAKLSKDKNRKNSQKCVRYFEFCRCPGKHVSSGRVPPPLCLLFPQIPSSICRGFAVVFTPVQLLRARRTGGLPRPRVRARSQRRPARHLAAGAGRKQR